MIINPNLRVKEKGGVGAALTPPSGGVAPILLSAYQGQQPSYSNATATGNPAPSIVLTKVLNAGGTVLASAAGTVVNWPAVDGTPIRIEQTLQNSSGSLVLTSNQITVAAAPADIGNWTPVVPTAVYGAVGTYISATQPGSRIYIIAPEDGEVPTNQADALDMIVFKSAAGPLVDRYGNTTQPKAGPKFGLSYGSDHLSPGPGVRKFKSYAMVAPKSGSGESCFEITSDKIVPLNSLGFRAHYPDLWLFAGGQTYNHYADLRWYLDTTGRPDIPVNRLCGAINTGGGASQASRSAVSVYGQATNGRARIICPAGNYGMLAYWAPSNIADASAMKFASISGFMFDGSVRSFPVAPVDWINFNQPNVNQALGLIGTGAGTYDFIIEDNHFKDNHGNLNIQTNTHTFVTQNALDDLTFRRNIIEDTWNDTATAQAIGTMVGAQSIAANTSAKVLLDTVGVGPSGAINTGGMFSTATGSFTTGATANYAVVMWLQLRLTATIAVGGYIEVAMYRNDAKVDYIRVPGTGVAGDVYNISEVLRRQSAATAGEVYDFRVTSSGATSSLVLTPAWCRGVFSLVTAGSGASGIFCQTDKGNKMVFEDNILLRCGFGVNPKTQATYVPNGVSRWDWDTLNHNIYFVGTNKEQAIIWRRNVSIMGAAGDGFRCAVDVLDSFFVQGYLGGNPEPSSPVAAGVVTNLFSRSILQKFKAVSGTTAGHPAWGLSTGSGAHTVFDDCIISDAGLANVNTSGYGIKVVGMDNPYVIQYAFQWKNDTEASIINCIIDAGATHSANLNEALVEANGASTPLCWWRGSITGWASTGNITGSTVTFVPAPGFTGTPNNWKWYTTPDWDAGFSLRPDITTASYVLTEADWGVWQGKNYLRISCVASGYQYPPGTGILMNASNCIVIKPVAKPVAAYFSLNNTIPIPPVPASSSLSLGALQSFASYGEAAAVVGGSNWNASVKTYMQTFGTVSSADGLPEYHAYVTGINPIVTAAQKGKWPATLCLGLVNHIRTGRGKAAIS